MPEPFLVLGLSHSRESCECTGRSHFHRVGRSQSWLETLNHQNYPIQNWSEWKPRQGQGLLWFQSPTVLGKKQKHKNIKNTFRLVHSRHWQVHVAVWHAERTSKIGEAWNRHGADLFESVIQVVDCDPAKSPLLLTTEYSCSLIWKGGLLQGFHHSLEDLIWCRAVLYTACTNKTNTMEWLTSVGINVAAHM